ncbi:DNA repair protein SWI5 homolog [Polistes fuscatus]|uniref:DNA repair protein SWI5 homolog n=1 Tax=Polistes fuscatus TaxID=30207 RepID=UPI001CAA3C55|nr:DNA repair protein SWI5 homolog [Polistes fuscatus]
MAFYRLNHRSEHIDSSLTMSSSFIDDTLDGYKKNDERDESMIVTKKKQLELKKIPLEDEKKQQFFKLLQLEKKLDTEYNNLKTSRDKYPSMKQTTNLLHEYNDIKDATQVVFGAVAEINNITVTSLHKDYGLPTNDS